MWSSSRTVTTLKSPEVLIMKNCKASGQIPQRTNLSLVFQKVSFLLCFIFFHISPLVCEGKEGRRGGRRVKWIEAGSRSEEKQKRKNK
jgi:hypothetical protein